MSLQHLLDRNALLQRGGTWGKGGSGQTDPPRKLFQPSPSSGYPSLSWEAAILEGGWVHCVRHGVLGTAVTDSE